MPVFRITQHVGALAALLPFVVALEISGIVEQSLTYNDGSDALTGMLIYKQMDGSARRPGLVLYGGP